MKNLRQIVSRVLGAGLLALALCIGTPAAVKADEAADAAAALQQQQLLLLMQTPEYQALLKQQQLLQQQALAQYQAALAAQYQAALNVFNNAQYLHEAAINQAYILNATQALQRAQYESMISREGLDYGAHLMEKYTRDQNNAWNAFLGYNGL